MGCEPAARANGDTTDATPVDLEHRFRSVTEGHGAALSRQSEHLFASSPGTQLLPVGRLEQLPPQALADEL